MSQGPLVWSPPTVEEAYTTLGWLADHDPDQLHLCGLRNPGLATAPLLPLGCSTPRTPIPISGKRNRSLRMAALTFRKCKGIFRHGG